MVLIIIMYNSYTYIVGEKANLSVPLQCLYRLIYSIETLMSDSSSSAFVPEPSDPVFALMDFVLACHKKRKGGFLHAI